MHSHSLISHLFNSAKCQEVVQTVVVPASQSSQSVLGGGVGLGPLMGWCLKASCLWPEDLPALKNCLIFSKLSTYKVMRAFLGSRFKDWGREKGRNLDICVYFLDLGLFPPECRSRFLPVSTQCHPSIDMWAASPASCFTLCFCSVFLFLRNDCHVILPRLQPSQWQH